MGFAIVSIAFSCTTQQKVVKVEPQIQEIKKEEQALKRKVAIARFSNETQYAKGVFYDKDNDPIGK
ncbi:MAG: penicillin-binding protein activator LpoB, partial [Candidatus Cloacimonetes bacterium]|nr:penicillin-binding protein activator LpoB [Candidatus Cloacimonadota bacterium]